MTTRPRPDLSTSFLATRALLDWALPPVPATAAPTFPEAVEDFDEAAAAVGRSGCRVVFCDLFDTLVQRDIAPASRIARKTSHFLQNELTRHGQPHSAEQVAYARERATASLQAASHARGENGEYTLGEVLQATVDLLCPEGDAAQRRALATAAEEYELAQELAHCHAIPGAADFLAALRQKHRVIVVSDTCLDRRTLSRLLEACGLAAHIDALYISGEQKANKRSGGLFSHICECEGLPPGNIVHVGDDPVADYLSPRAQGLAAILLRHRELHAAQGELARRIELAESLGEMRYLPEFAAVPASEDDAVRFGAEAVGIAIGLFALHVLELHRRHDYDRILFVSRDGHLPYLAFRTLAASLAGDAGSQLLARAEYVQLSRLSTLCPQGDAGIEQAMFYATLVAGQNSALGLFASLGLDTEKYRTLLAAAGFSEAELNSAALDTKVRLQQTLHETPALRATMADDLQRKTASLAAYLEQRGFFAARRVLLVDVGWRYRIATNLLEAFGDRTDFPELHCALLGYTHELPHPRIVCHPGYLYDALRPHPLERLVLDHRNIIEALCSSLEGTCIGYTDAPAASPLNAPPDADPQGLRQRIHAGAHQAFGKIADIYKRYHLGPEFRLATLVNLLAPIASTAHPLHDIVSALGLPTDGWFHVPGDSPQEKQALAARSFVSEIAPRISVSFAGGTGMAPASRDMEKLLALIEKGLQTRKPLILWGFGLLGRLLYPHLAARIRLVVDANPALQGQTLGEHVISAPEDLTPEILARHTVLFTPLARQRPRQLDEPECEVLSVANWFSQPD